MSSYKNGVDNCPTFNFTYLSISYFNFLKFNPIGKEIAPAKGVDSMTLEEERD